MNGRGEKIRTSGPCLPKTLGRLQAIVFNRHAGDARGRKCLASHNRTGLGPANFRNRCPLSQRGMAYGRKGRFSGRGLVPVTVAVSDANQVDTFVTDKQRTIAVTLTASGPF